MADNKEANSRVRIAGKESVNMALELLRSASSKTGKRKRHEDSEASAKVSSHCLSNLLTKESNAALGFSENHAITEMRSCLARRDWTSLRELFPLILGCYSEIEPIIWRYALTLLLCSPERDSTYFQEFMEMCTGAQSLENSGLLQRLLTLRTKDS